MEMQIQDLISSIRSEGVEKAKKEAESILLSAEDEARAIRAKAEEEAQKLLEKARKEIELEKKSAKATLEQAARDAVLTFRRSVESEIDKIIRTEVKKTVSGKTLEEVITLVVSSELVGKKAVIEVSDLEALSESFVEELSRKIGKGLELKASSLVSGGFRVVEKDGSGYIDLTDEEISKLIHPYLSQGLRELI